MTTQPERWKEKEEQKRPHGGKETREVAFFALVSHTDEIEKSIKGWFC